MGQQGNMSAMRLTESDLSEAFKLFDTDGSGSISSDEMLFAMKSLGFKEVTKQDVRQIMDKVDFDRSGQIEEAEFVRIVQERLSGQGSDEEIKKAYELFKDDSGVITLASLKKIASEVEGGDVDEKLLKRIMSAAGNEQAGGECIIRFDDFKHAVTKYERPVQSEIGKTQRRLQNRGGGGEQY